LTSKRKSKIFQCLVISKLSLIVDYLTSNKMFLFSQQTKKLLVKIYSFTLRGKITDIQKRSEISDLVRPSQKFHLTRKIPVTQNPWLGQKFRRGQVFAWHRSRIRFGFCVCWKNVTGCLLGLYLAGVKQESDWLCLVGTGSREDSVSKFTKTGLDLGSKNSDSEHLYYLVTFSTVSHYRCVA